MVTPESVPVRSSNLASGILFIKAEMKGSLGSRLRPEMGVMGDLTLVGLIAEPK